MKKIGTIAYATMGIFFLLPEILYAQATTPSRPGDTTTPNLSGGGSMRLENPLGSDTLIEFFNDLLDVVMVFAIPLIVLFIIFAGFQYVMARGNPAKIATASNALLFAVIGGALILGAKVILLVISGTIAALGS